MIDSAIASAFSSSCEVGSTQEQTPGEGGSGVNYGPPTRQLLNSCSRWRKSKNDTKTTDDKAPVPVNERLAKLLAELHLCDNLPVAGHILRRSRNGSSLTLDNLLRRVIIARRRAAVIE